MKQGIAGIVTLLWLCVLLLFLWGSGGCASTHYKNPMPQNVVIHVPIKVRVVPDEILYKYCPPTESNKIGIVIGCTRVFDNGYEILISENAVLEQALGEEFRHIIDEELEKRK